MKYFAKLNGEELEVDIEGQGDRLEVTTPRGALNASLVPRSGGSLFSIRLGTRSVEVSVLERSASTLELILDGERHLVGVQCEIDRVLGGPEAMAEGGTWVLRSVMPGIVTRVLGNPGEVVAAGQPLLLLEAMKMENEVRADRSGKIQTLHVAAGETVQSGAPLVTLVAGDRPS